MRVRDETKHLVITVDCTYMMEYHASPKVFWQKRDLMLGKRKQTECLKLYCKLKVKTVLIQ